MSEKKKGRPEKGDSVIKRYYDKWFFEVVS